MSEFSLSGSEVELTTSFVPVALAPILTNLIVVNTSHFRLISLSVRATEYSFGCCIIVFVYVRDSPPLSRFILAVSTMCFSWDGYYVDSPSRPKRASA